jgi:hypothetical protein
MSSQYVIVFCVANSEHEKQGPVLQWQSPQVIHLQPVQIGFAGIPAQLVLGVQISKNLDTDFSLYVRESSGGVIFMLSTRNAHLNRQFEHEVWTFTKEDSGEWVCTEDWPHPGHREHDLVYEHVSHGGRGLDKLMEILQPMLHHNNEQEVAW